MELTWSTKDQNTERPVGGAYNTLTVSPTEW